jgi:hypothetical protein
MNTPLTNKKTNIQDTPTKKKTYIQDSQNKQIYKTLKTNKYTRPSKQTNIQDPQKNKYTRLSKQTNIQDPQKNKYTRPTKKQIYKTLKTKKRRDHKA